MKRVVITGMGIVSPVGTGIEYAWKNIVNGVSGVRKIDTFDNIANRRAANYWHRTWAI